MSQFTAIRAVTDTLKALLLDELPGLQIDEKKSPADLRSTTSLLGLYLYRVEPNAFAANLDWQASGATELIGPPLGLNLHYLVTPYGADELAIQELLGEVMRAFHDRAVVRPGDPVLAAALADMAEELRIVPRSVPLSDLLDLWRGFQNTSFRLCVTYEVSVVLLDSGRKRGVQRVQERLVDLIPRR